MNRILHTETIPGGWHWSHVVKAGTALKLTDLEGGGCASVVLFNPRATSERYNMPDTLKAQFIARITRGNALYSDMGRILFSVLEDEVGWHDPLGGLVDDELVASRFGTKDYQAYRNEFTKSGRRALLTEMARHELSARDLTTPINFFSKVVVTSEGDLTWAPQETRGKSVTLQAEMDVLVVLAATQHRLDPRSSWSPSPIEVTLLESSVPAEANPAWALCEQNKRGFHNSAVYAL